MNKMSQAWKEKVTYIDQISNLTYLSKEKSAGYGFTKTSACFMVTLMPVPILCQFSLYA
jgi:outer membrane protease